MQRFGEKLRRLRERRGMTQQQLADTFGFSDVYAHYLETGKKKPNVELLLKLAQFFGVTMDALARDDLEVGEDAG